MAIAATADALANAPSAISRQSRQSRQQQQQHTSNNGARVNGALSDGGWNYSILLRTLRMVSPPTSFCVILVKLSESSLPWVLTLIWSFPFPAWNFWYCCSTKLWQSL